MDTLDDLMAIIMADKAKEGDMKNTINRCNQGEKITLDLPADHPVHGIELIHLRDRNCYVPSKNRTIVLEYGTKVNRAPKSTSLLFGIDLADLTDDLYEVSAEFASKPVDTIDMTAKFEACKEGIERYGYFKELQKNYQHIDTENWKEFSFDEICKAVWSSFTQTIWYEVFDTVEKYRIIEKLRLSNWHWGTHEKDWNSIARNYNSLRRFTFAEGFEVRLTYTYGSNYRGTTEHSNGIDKATWIDAEFAYLIFKDGKHVLTIGFSPTEVGLLVNQVQLKQEKGNRWLYKLPKHYLDYTLERLAVAFDCPIYLVDGTQQADAIAAEYTKVVFKPEVHKRIADFYNRSLSNFQRKTSETFERNKRSFYQLIATTELA